MNTGSLQVSPEQLVSGLFVEYDDTVATIYDLRFPRIFIAMVGGAALAVSGGALWARAGSGIAVSAMLSARTMLMSRFCIRSSPF